MRLTPRRRPSRDAWLGAVAEENKVLQDFALRHEAELPPGMFRLLNNLNYAVKNGTRLAGKDIPEWLKARG